jgi:hypothetical protein
MDDPRVDALFSSRPEEFVAARDALARALKAEGSADAAAEVKRLRRPTLGAWTLNQLARTSRDDLDALARAGADLLAAQSAGPPGAAERIRRATAARRDAMDRLLRAASSVLTGAGHPADRTTMERVEGSLLAAGTDTDAAAALASGRLERELPPPSGFGALLDGTAGPPGISPARRTPSNGPARERRARRERDARLAHRRAEARAEADRLDRAARQAERAARQARRQADAARARAEKLEAEDSASHG